MMGTLHWLVAAMALISVVHDARGDFRFSNTLGSNMVLQRSPQQAVVWGWSTAQDSVTVTLDALAPVVAKSDPTGMWKASLPAMEAGGPHTVKAVSGLNKTIITLENVLFGDVYICSGQSNMQFTVDQGFNAAAETAAADEFPDIRVFTAALKASNKPEPELLGIAEPWANASKAAVGGGNWNYLSAVCWFFGRDVYVFLDKKVPIGLISDNWGGTTVESWSSADALAKCNQTDDSGMATHDQPGTAEAGNSWDFQEEGKRDMEVERGSDLSVRYNGMINPYLPMQVSGAIWYQGESNVGAGPRKGGEYYACQFSAMIADWRVKFNQPDMYFGFVQLAPWISGNTTSTLIPELRQSQLAALELPKVGVATAADKGDPTSPFGSIHPRDKQDVGHRLALNVMAVHYAMTETEYQSAIGTGADMTSSKALTPSTVQAVYTIQTSASADIKWQLVKSECPAVPVLECSTFEFQSSSDMSWHAADVELQAGKIVVTGTVPGTTSTAAHPVSGIRYGYSTWPVLPIYSAAGLPLMPFSIQVK